MKQAEIKYIIKASVSKQARPEYFAVDSDQFLCEMVHELEDWHRVQVKEVVKKDNMLEGILRRCALGSASRRENLQIYYNAQ